MTQHCLGTSSRQGHTSLSLFLSLSPLEMGWDGETGRSGRPWGKAGSLLPRAGATADLGLSPLMIGPG